MSAPRRLTYPQALAVLASKGVRVQDAEIHRAVRMLAQLNMICAPPVRPPRPPRRGLEDPQRWLRALAHEGWSTPELAEATGISKDSLVKIRRGSGDRAKVSQSTYDAVKSVYEDQLSPINFSKVAAGMAQRMGWPTREQLAAGVQESQAVVG